MKKTQCLFFLICAVMTSMGCAGDMEKADALFDKGQYQKALQIYLKPELQKNPSVQTRIGWIYGHATALLDEKKSIEWFQKAADQGYPPGQYNLASSYENGDGIEKDYEKALFWYRKASNQNLPAAYNSLGNMYADGRGIKKDSAKAVELYRKASDLGSSTGMCSLAFMQTFGEGTKKDYTEARKTLDLCLKTDANEDCCISRMADLYRYGWGVAKDHAKANAYQRQAAALGSGIAMFSLGVAYDYGNGVKKDPQTALEWYLKGAEAGNARAMYRLYEIYQYGKLGQPVDKARAKEWLAKAEPAMKAQNVTRNAIMDQFRLAMED